MGYYAINKFNNKQDKEKEAKEISWETLIEKSDSTSTEFTFTNLSQLHNKIRENTTKSAYEMLSLADKAQLTPTIETMNLLIYNSFKNGFFSDAEKLKKEIFDVTSPIYPDIQTFNFLLKGLQIEVTSNNQSSKYKPSQESLDIFDEKCQELTNLMK